MKFFVNGNEVPVSDSIDIRIEVSPDGESISPCYLRVIGGRLIIQGQDGGAALNIEGIDGGCLVLRGGSRVEPGAPCGFGTIVLFPSGDSYSKPLASGGSGEGIDPFEQYLAELTENDAGFRNERDYHFRRGLPSLSLEDYKDILIFRERDCQQMIQMGR